MTMEVWASQNIKIVIYQSVDILKSGNVSMYKALLKLGRPSECFKSVGRWSIVWQIKDNFGSLILQDLQIMH